MHETRAAYAERKRGAFTLVELLVVIAIMGILAVVVFLVLNPSQLLAQSRDASRMSDIATINLAASIFLSDQGGGTGVFMGSSSVTYVSVFDPTATTTAGTNCGGLGGNFPTSSSNFACAASSTYRHVDSTGWIPINFNLTVGGSPFGAIPVDPVNSTSSNQYYTYQANGNQFRIAALPESLKYAAQFASNSSLFVSGSNTNLYGGAWIPVPGNSTFGTSNFYVMKYSAGCSDGRGNALNDTTGSSDTIADHVYSNNYTACTGAGRQVAALAGAWPITGISQTTAASYCQALGGHLLTNKEWQTVAWNLEGQSANWSGGSVGSGSVYVGHSDNVPAYASPADGNDVNSCAGTDGPASCGGTGSNAAQQRALTLSNGNVIWDMAGNVWQWTGDTIVGNNEPNAGAGAFAWRDFPSITSWGSMTQKTAGPLNSAWGISKGMGYILSEGTTTDPATYGIVRGGSWPGGSTNGVEAMELNNAPGNLISDTGFRCAR